MLAACASAPPPATPSEPSTPEPTPPPAATSSVVDAAPIAIEAAPDAAPIATAPRRKPARGKRPPQPSWAKIVNVYDAPGFGTRIVLDRGTADGVTVGRRGVVLDGDGWPRPGGGFTIDQAEAHVSRAGVTLSMDTVVQSPFAELVAP